MTPEQIIPWKRELTESMRTVYDRFNEAHPESRLEYFDAQVKAFGLHLVQAVYPLVTWN
jgi:hypothetical protein